MNHPTAIVTGASSGIGYATVAALVDSGWKVLGAARRADRLKTLKEKTGCDTLTCDVTSPADVAKLRKHAQDLFGKTLSAVVNIAGGAFGVDSVESADLERWRRMYELNVLGATRVTQEFLPMLRANGTSSIVMLTSTAAQAAYAGGGGYNAAKAGEHMVARALRLELSGEPIRVIEIAPGMVHTEEFSLVRLDGDQAAADAVYAGVENPLTARDIADVVAFSLNLPAHVNLDLVTVRPVAQASNYHVARDKGV